MNGRGVSSLASRLTEHGGGSPDEFVARRVSDPHRVAAVRRLVPLYRPPSVHFDRLTRLVAQLLLAPVALLTLVEPDRQFFVSSYGLPDDLARARQTPIDYSVCQFAVATGAPLIVPDVSEEPHLVSHPAVVEFGVASYAGIPLLSGEQPVGTLCVLDFLPRDWTDDQLSILATLANVCMDEIRLCGYERRATFQKEWQGISDDSAMWR